MSADDYFEKGYRYFKKGDYQAAVKYLTRCIKMRTDSDDYYWCGRAFYELGQVRKAREIFNSGIELFNNPDVWHYHWRAVCNYKLGKYSDALNDMNQCIKLRTVSGDYCWLGRCYYKLKQIRKAREIFNSGIELFNNPDIWNYHWRAICNYDLGNYRDALNDINHCIKHRCHVDEYHFRATIYYELGEYQEALCDLKYYFKLQTDPSAYNYYQLANVYYEVGDYQNAFVNLAHCIKLQDGEMGALSFLLRSAIYQRLGNNELALADFEQFTELNTEKVTLNAYILSAKIHYGLGDYQTALASIEQAIKLADEPRPSVYYIRASIHKALGKSSEAGKGYRYTRSLAAKTSDDYYYLAKAHMKFDDKRVAYRSFVTALNTKYYDYSYRYAAAKNAFYLNDKLSCHIHLNHAREAHQHSRYALMVGMLCMQEKDYASAVKEFPEVRNLAEKGSAQWLTATAYLALAYSAVGDNRNACEVLNEGIKLIKASDSLKTYTIRFYALKAKLHYQNKFAANRDYQEVKKYLANILELRTDTSDGYCLTGILDFEQHNDAKKAIASFTKVIEAEQDKPLHSEFKEFFLVSAYVNRSYLHWSLEDYPAALADAQQAKACMAEEADNYSVLHDKVNNDDNYIISLILFNEGLAYLRLCQATDLEMAKRALACFEAAKKSYDVKELYENTNGEEYIVPDRQFLWLFSNVNEFIQLQDYLKFTQHLIKKIPKWLAKEKKEQEQEKRKLLYPRCEPSQQRAPEAKRPATGSMLITEKQRQEKALLAEKQKLQQQRFAEQTRIAQEKQRQEARLAEEKRIQQLAEQERQRQLEAKRLQEQEEARQQKQEILTMLDRAYQYEKQGDYPQALLYYQQVTVLDKNNLIAWHGKARVLLQQDNIQAAKAIYHDTILTLNAKDELALQAIAKLEQAEREQKQRIARQHTEERVQILLAKGQQALAGNVTWSYREALQHFQAAAKILPSPTAELGIAQAYEGLQRYQAAMVCYQRLMQYADYREYASVAYGRIQQKIIRQQEQQQYQQWLATVPKDAAAAILKGAIEGLPFINDADIELEGLCVKGKMDERMEAKLLDFMEVLITDLIEQRKKSVDQPFTQYEYERLVRCMSRALQPSLRHQPVAKSLFRKADPYFIVFARKIAEPSADNDLLVALKKTLEQFKLQNVGPSAPPMTPSTCPSTTSSRQNSPRTEGWKQQFFALQETSDDQQAEVTIIYPELPNEEIIPTYKTRHQWQ